MPQPFDMTEAEYATYLETASIGGSQIGTIMGLNRYDGPAKVYDRILGLPTGYVPDNPHMMRGRAMEPVCADAYTRETGRILTTYPRSIREGIFRATPDRGIVSDWRHEGPGILEIKCPAHRGFERTKADGVDSSYYAQLQLYMHLTGCSWGSFAFWSADQWELYWFDVALDPEFVEGMLMAAQTFWQTHVVPRVRPAVNGVATVFPPPYLGREYTRLADPESRVALASLRDATESVKLAEARKEAAMDAFKARMAALGYDRVEVPGLGKVSWTSGTRRTFKRELLEAAHPELDLAPYFVESSVQTFRPTFATEE